MASHLHSTEKVSPAPEIKEPTTFEKRFQARTVSPSKDRKRVITRRKFLGLLGGGVTGATLGAIFAPRSGQETPPRYKLKDGKVDFDFDARRNDEETNAKKHEITLAMLESIASDPFFLNAESLQLVFHGHDHESNMDTALVLAFNQLEDKSFVVDQGLINSFFSDKSGLRRQQRPENPSTPMKVENLGNLLRKMRTNLELFPNRFIRMEVSAQCTIDSLREFTKIDPSVHQTDIFRNVMQIFGQLDLKIQSSTFRETQIVSTVPNTPADFDISLPSTEILFKMENNSSGIESFFVYGPNFEELSGMVYFEVVVSNVDGKQGNARVYVQEKIPNFMNNFHTVQDQRRVGDENAFYNLTMDLMDQRDKIAAHIATLYPSEGNRV